MKPTRLDSKLSRRNTLGFLAGSVVVVGCGGSNESGSGIGSGGTGGGGSGGVGAGGVGGINSGGSGGVATGGAGGVATGGSAGMAGSAGVAGAGGGQCGVPTPGCFITDDNILGPFYKADAPFKADLTDGSVGTPLIVSGTVYCSDCVTPLANAIVDVWQANDSGIYDSVGYVLRGRMETNAEGKYEYASILPGFYLNGAQYRPRHIHYKVSHAQGAALTTQLYFEGDPYIPIDPFVKPGLIRPLVQQGSIQHCTFDIVLG
jgi:catechol 1,2-dioxygenase